MATHCVNRSSKEFQELLEKTGLNPVSLAADISLYQEKNGLDKWPSIEDILQSDVITLNQARDLTSIQFQKLTTEEKARTIEQVTKEHRSITALKDLAHKLAHRIGGKVEFENRTDVDWKGYNQGSTSVLNEAYMTLDTPFHEILAHPIIRAIKYGEKSSLNYHITSQIEKTNKRIELAKQFKNKEITKEEYEKQKQSLDKEYTKKESQLYQSLLKELETGRGKEVFEQVKRNYNKKFERGKSFTFEGKDYIAVTASKTGYRDKYGDDVDSNELETALFGYELKHKDKVFYTLEEQQEEAIVTLLGLMAADKLDAKKDATLISKLKELWKEISDLVKSLLKQDGIKIDELPITTTLNDLAEIMAYGNNKIILPGYKVEYSTPLGNKYDTLEEVNNEIRDLADSNVEVDLSGVNINKDIKEINDVSEIPKSLKQFSPTGYDYDLFFTDDRSDSGWSYGDYETPMSEEKVINAYNKYISNNTLNSFIERNKEYEQSKEIIEQWKKENNIQYDPEEVYSRGQGFYSSIGAYSNLELDLLFQNLLQHIQDNKKAGGEFTISSFTKPIDKRLKHIEGTGDRVRFVIYPKSEHIKWAAPTDVYSGSVWDAHEKVSKDKKSELLGVSFTKAPALRNINEVSPNLADIIDNLSHVHNELGIELTTNNFRIEYDDNIDYSTKKLIDNVNKILDEKYGKLVKPEINISNERTTQFKLNAYDPGSGELYVIGNYKTQEEAEQEAKKHFKDFSTPEKYYNIEEIIKQSGKQPTQTRENTTSIESVKSKLSSFQGDISEIPNKFKGYTIQKETGNKLYQGIVEKINGIWKINNQNISEEQAKKLFFQDEEYTSQALINLKVAALKEVARKYPRSLITSKVVPINPNTVGNSEIQYSKRTTIEKTPKPIKVTPSTTVEKVFNSTKEFLNTNNIPLNLINQIRSTTSISDIVSNVHFAARLGNQIAEGDYNINGKVLISLLGKDHWLYKAMANQVVDSQFYDQVVEEGYSTNEDELKLEALGRLMTNFIIEFNVDRPVNKKTKIWFRELQKYYKEKFGGVFDNPNNKSKLEDMIRELDKLPKSDVPKDDVEGLTKRQLMKEFGLPNRPVSEEESITIMKKVRDYNRTYGTSYFVNFSPFAETVNYQWFIQNKSTGDNEGEMTGFIPIIRKHEDVVQEVLSVEEQKKRASSNMQEFEKFGSNFVSQYRNRSIEAFDSAYPQYRGLSESEKIYLMTSFEEGDITITCEI